ncbi:MAG: tetratricopeptide repeat protein [Nodosilinea sp.]
MVVKRLLDGRFQFIRAVSTKHYTKTYLMLDQSDPAKGRCIVKRLQLPTDDPVTFKFIQELLDRRIQTLQRLPEDQQLEQRKALVREGNGLYWIRGYIPGHGLQQELSTHQAQPEPQVRGFLVEALTILDKIQQQGVVHQNLHPNNLIRHQENGHLVLVDFGLVQELPADQNGQSWNGRSPDYSGDPTSFNGSYIAWPRRNGPSAFYPDHFAVGLMALQLATGLVQEGLPDSHQANFSDQIKLQLDECSSLGEGLKSILLRMICPGAASPFLRAKDILALLTVPERSRPDPPDPTQISPTHPEPVNVPISTPVDLADHDLDQALASNLAAGEQLQRQRSGARISPRRLFRPPVMVAMGVGLSLLALGLGLQLPQRWRTNQLSQKAEKAAQAGDMEAATTYLDQLLQAHPADTQALVQRSQLWLKKDDPEKALRDLNQALAIDPASPRWNFQRGNLRLDLGDLEGAISDYTRAVELNPNYSDAYLNRGNARADLGDEAGAVQDYTTVLELTDKTDVKALAYLNRCLSRSNLGDQTAALEDCSTALDLQPGNAMAYGNRGLVKRRLDDLKGALQDFTIAIQINPGNPEPYYNRGLTRQSMGDLGGAMADFNQTVKLNPDHPFVYYDRGILHGARGEVDRAIADLERVASTCLDLGRTGCFEDAQYQIEHLKQTGKPAQ